MVDQISDILNKNLKEGAIAIFTTKALKTDDNTFKMIGPFKKNMSWGLATVYIYQKQKMG
jgi:hypothetical protein